MGNLLSHDRPSQRKRKREEEESAEEAFTSSSKRAKEENTEGASTSSSISPEATGAESDQYVFLSFRGPDTRKEFTDHLYHSLKNAGIVPFGVFKDDKNIPIGEEFPKQIFDAIEQSKISIPIISENYASSKWCLRELIRIMDRKDSPSSHTVLPIFYKVAPSDVRRLNINSGWSFPFRWFQKRFNEEDSQKGRQALEDVSRLQGWESSKFANGHEGELIRHVVETVQSKLQEDFQLDIPKELVGLDGPLMDIMNWIRIPSINARMIGIYAMGGMGKTTLAKCIYNQLKKEFKHASFLLNIGRAARNPHGIEKLQRHLINKILQPQEKIKVSTIDVGINIIKSRFKGKKVLILLDDIDDQDQLDALARECNWFMPGSLIIVTTRNKTVLDQSKFEVDYKYKLEGLDKEQSMLLFESHAFRGVPSPQDFKKISHVIISTLGGLPLALQVVGASLYKQEDRKYWEDLGRLLKSQQSQPFPKLRDTLRISYDALTREQHKQMFVDIACFFIGESSQFAMCVWESYGFIPSIGIEELKSRCLIEINFGDFFEMHDQLRDLGRSIFCERQPLENRSRPWDADYEGVPRILKADTFKRFDDLMRAASSGDKDLSEVIWLQWCVWMDDESDVHLSTANLRLPKLVVLDLTLSKITEDWEGWSWLGRASPRLRALRLGYCEKLRSTPDLSAFTQLKILNLRNCDKLEHLHPSIGELKSLVSLNLFYCVNLKELPEEVGELKDLEELHASFCWSLRGIPSSIGRLKSLRTLNLYYTSISDLPESIQNLSSLQRLNLWGCDKLRSVPELPSSLAHLDVSRASPRLPQLCSLIHLVRLGLEECHLLEDITDLPSRLWKLDGFRYLEELTISNCSSIEILDLSELVRLKRLRAFDCNNLVEIRGLDNLEILEDISIKDCYSIKNLLYPKSERLKKIVVQSCNNLVKIQGPVHGAMFLEELFITECKSLETLPDLTGCEKLRRHIIRDCKKLTQIQGYENNLENGFFSNNESCSDDSDEYYSINESCSDDGDESYSNNESCSDDGDES